MRRSYEYRVRAVDQASPGRSLRVHSDHEEGKVIGKCPGVRMSGVVRRRKGVDRFLTLVAPRVMIVKSPVSFSRYVLCLRSKGGLNCHFCAVAHGHVLVPGE